MSNLCPFRARVGHCRECDYYYLFGCNEEDNEEENKDCKN